MPGVEAPRGQALVVGRRFGREREELRQQPLLAGVVALLEQGLRVIGVLDVLVAVEAATWRAMSSSWW